MSHTDYLRPSGWRYVPGQTVLVIGPADGGPVMTPLEVSADPASLFGGGPLCETVRAGLQIGPDLQWIAMRLNGMAPRLTLPPVGGGSEPALILEGVSGTSAFNGLLLVLEEDELGAPSLKLPGGYTYRLSSYPYLALLIEQMNRDALAGRQPFWASSTYHDLPASALMELAGEYPIEDGSDGAGLSRDELFFLLDDALRILDGRPLDAVVLAGLYFDDLHQQSAYGGSSYGSAIYGNDAPADRLTVVDSANAMRPVSYHTLLSEWCYQQTGSGRIVVGLVPCRPLPDPSLLLSAGVDYVRVLTEHVSQTAGGQLTALDGAEIGRYLQVVSGEGRVGGYSTTMEAAAAVAYLRSGVDAATNAAIPAVLPWELDSPQRQRLADYGVTTFYTDPRGQTRVWSGVTAAPSHLDAHWSINMRQVQLVIAATMDSLDRFIGTDFRSAYLSRQIDREIQQILNQFRQANIVSEYTFSVEYIPLNKDVRLNLSLRPRGGLEYQSVQGQVTMA